MLHLMGILVDVSFSMRCSVGDEAVKPNNGPWARSVFKVIDELIKHDVPSSNKTFALAFGSNFHSRQVFDLLGTVEKAKEEQSYIEDLKSERTPREMIDEILYILENEGAPRVRTWAHMNVLLSVIDDTTAAAMLYFLQRNPDFARRFVHEILPQECREIVLEVSSLAKEGVYHFAGLLSRVGLVRPDFQESATEESVKEVIEKGKQLLEEFRMVAVNKAAIKSVQTASEILHDSVGDQEVTDERVDELIETVEPYIYGGTPFFRAIKYSVELFSHSEFANHTKILFILSDGAPGDGDGDGDGKDERHPQLQKLYKLEVKIASCYITPEKISNPRRLYGSLKGEWMEPAKFMFRISSIIKTEKIPRTLFVKKGWQIDITNNETRLFFQVNHPDVIKDVCDMAKRAVLSQDVLSEILSDVDLDLYINNEKEKFKPTPEGQGDKATCYAHAAAAVMHLQLLAKKRIIGRVGGYPDFDELREKLITKYGEEEKGVSTFQVLREVCPEYRLKCKSVNVVQAIQAISEKRPVVATFYLTEAQWDRFDQFYKENRKGILTKSYLNSKTDSENKPVGHAVVLTSYDAESLRLMNSHGEDFAHGGFFRVQDADVLGLKFVDVYWDLNDLREEEKKAFKKYGPEVARNLIKSLKGLQEATYKCPKTKCNAVSKVEEYSGHALNAKCPKCRRTFNPNEEDGDLAWNLYLTSLIC
ncbi:uncharacterized protein [Montipora capricornis]|uniref:uncharacterized protein n=1 Tax=Montipora capricornis TaxID=246305 RepID=UPI0035F10491